MSEDRGAPEGYLPLPLRYADPPIPMGVDRILVFGGSFDPPHRGHAELARLARERAGLGWLLVIPAGRSPHKDKAPMFDGEERLRLVRAAFGSDDRCSVSRIEIDRLERDETVPSYTVDTLHTLRGFLPLGVEMRLLIGADQAIAFDRWAEPRAILALAEPVIMLRAGEAERGDALAAMIAQRWPAGERGVSAADWRGRMVDLPLVDASSTRVRELLLDVGEHEDELRVLLGDKVYEQVCAIRDERARRGLSG